MTNSELMRAVASDLPPRELKQGDAPWPVAEVTASGQMKIACTITTQAEAVAMIGFLQDWFIEQVERAKQ